MGRYSYSQPSSSTEGGTSSTSSTCRRRRSGTCVGVPNRCFCGLEPVLETSTTDLNPGRRFYGCRNNEDGGYHVFKWWDEAMTEEFNELKTWVGQLAESVQDIKLFWKPSTEMMQSIQYDLLKTEDGLCQLKEQMQQKQMEEKQMQQKQKRFGDSEVKCLMVAGLNIVGLMLMFVLYLYK